MRLSEVSTGKELRKIQVPYLGPVAFAFTPDSKVLAVAGWTDFVARLDPKVRLYDVGTGKEVRALAAPGEKPGARALPVTIYSPDGKLLACRSSLPVAASHTLTELSHEPDAIVVPSGENATLLTESLWPSSCPRW